MLLDAKTIHDSRQRLSKMVGALKETSDFCYFGSDPTRLKIVFLFSIHKELCPTDLSDMLEISISGISHQLALLEKSGLVEKMKMGQMVCYSLSKKGHEFFKFLKL